MERLSSLMINLLVTGFLATGAVGIIMMTMHLFDNTIYQNIT